MENPYAVDFLETSFDVFVCVTDVMIPTDKAFVPHQASRQAVFDDLFRDSDITEMIDVVLGGNRFIPVPDDQLVMLMGIHKRTAFGVLPDNLAFVIRELNDIPVAESGCQL